MRCFQRSAIAALGLGFPLYAVANPATAPGDPGPQAGSTAAAGVQIADPDRIDHPVVYLGQSGAPAEASSETQRAPHPVVYDTEPAPQQPRPDADRIPHPVVYLDEGPSEPGTDTDSEAAIEPPNPDYDPTDTAAQPAPSDTIEEHDAGAPESRAAAVAEDFEPSAAAVAFAELVESKAAVALDEAEWAGVVTTYQARNFEPVWLAETGLTPAGRKLVESLDSADQWGLNPSRFATPDVADAGDGAQPLSPPTRAELELRLTAAVLRYANHARGGRIINPTEQLSSYIDRKPQLKDPAAVLGKLFAAADPSAVLHALHPKHPQFEQLRQRYLAMKSAAARPEIVRIPNGALLRQGMSHPHVALLRKRLKISKVAPQDGTAFDPEVFDDTVLAAVKAFQESHNLSVDGLVGSGTRRALNDIAVPDPRKLLVNMEQWRWMPDDLGNTYIWVNLPEFKVRFIRDGEVVHTERIIAGKYNQQTPVFSDELETLYFHPKWHVPQSIKVNELYPSLARGGRYFRSQGLRVAYNGRPVNPYNIDWTTQDIRRFHVYQPPGRGNVLGVVKFTFPNKHQVYMHDTPTKHLFKNKQRMYSHGCMRVRNPVRLAELIVDASNGLSTDDVSQILNGPVQETPVKLDRKVPVHVTYFTAWVDEDGKEQAAKDIYGHEAKIKLALDGRFDQIAVGPDHLAPVKLKPVQPQFYGTTAVQDFFKNLFPGF